VAAADGRVAVVVGATGLVGSHLVQQLLEDARVGEVVVLARRPTGVVDPRLSEHVVDFDQPAAWRDLVRGDALFSALGTSRRAAGSREGQYRVDHTYQLHVAEAAATSGVPSYVLVSSIGARLGSPSFYLRMKAELERDVAALGLRRVSILRPGPLAGERAERRRGEEMAAAVLGVLPRWRALAAVRPVQGADVARAAIAAAWDESQAPGVHIIAPADIFRLAAA
jgi:uncharacterized protein YbjT (DUF2867 family)